MLSLGRLALLHASWLNDIIHLISIPDITESENRHFTLYPSGGLIRFKQLLLNVVSQDDKLIGKDGVLYLFAGRGTISQSLSRVHFKRGFCQLGRYRLNPLRSVRASVWNHPCTF